MFKIPLFIGYQFKANNFVLSTHAGVSLGLLRGVEGASIDATGQGISYFKNEVKNFSKIVYTAHLKSKIGLPLSKKLGVFAETALNYNLNATYNSSNYRTKILVL